MKAYELARILMLHPNEDVCFADVGVTPVAHALVLGVQRHRLRQQKPETYFVLYNETKYVDDNGTLLELFR